MTIGARVCAEYESLSRDLHRTWLQLCHALTAQLSPTNPVLQFKLFSTKLATVFPASEQLNVLRLAISNEPSIKGAQILWIRQVYNFFVFSSAVLSSAQYLVVGQFSESFIIHYQSVWRKGPGQYARWLTTYRPNEYELSLIHI